jgi:hypothetical protein
VSALAEIYALTDPDGSIRYIGKANVAADRLKGHMRDARRRPTPVYAWIRKLADGGKAPGLLVLEVADDWREAERRLIALHRAAGARLLNVAEGGDEPFCPVHVRAANGRANAAKRSKRKWRLMREMGDMLRRGHVSDQTKAKMRSRPDVFGQFAEYLG